MFAGVWLKDYQHRRTESGSALEALFTTMRYTNLHLVYFAYLLSYGTDNKRQSYGTRNSKQHGKIAAAEYIPLDF